MIVGKPEVFCNDQSATLVAEIRKRPTGAALPETLWFRVADTFKAGLAESSDPFLVALVPVAMALGEPLVIEGKVSPRLMVGLREYTEILHTWWPRMFARVQIGCAGVSGSSIPALPRSVGATFSGGVDSFYTLHEHRAAREPFEEYRLTHSLMINGFDNDVDMTDSGLFQMLHQTYEPMLRAQGIALVEMKTNLQQFRLAAMTRKDLHLTFGAFLAASALALGNMFGRFYIPSSYHYRHLVRDGSHPMVDHLFSTEGTQFIHDGARASRVEKTIAIASWPDVHSRLRVCFHAAAMNPKRRVIANCGECEKCLRTMIPLEVAGLLPRFAAFPSKLSSRNIRKIRYLSSSSRSFAFENLLFALRKKRLDLVGVLMFVILKGKILSLFVRPFFLMLPKNVQRWIKTQAS